MSLSRSSFGFSAIAAFCLLVQAAHAQLPTTTLQTIFPPGGKIGESAEVTLSGSDLDGVDRLIFSHEGIKSAPKMSDLDGLLPEQRPVDNQFTVNIADNVPPGVYEVRAVGRFGASNPRSFHVTRLTEVAKDSTNRDFESAQPLEIGSVVSGTMDANYYDHYRLSLKADQRVLIDCIAQRIDSRMDPTLVIYSAEGKELERIRDVAGADPVISFTAPSDGDYVVAVFDFLYRGGNEYIYRLAVHEGPRVDFVFPPVGEPGKTTKFTLYGRNLPGGQPAEGLTMEGQALEKVTVDVALPGDDKARGLQMGERMPPASARLNAMKYQLDQANPVLIGFAEAPVVIEENDNETAETAQKVAVPCEFVGQFFPAQDRDWIEFEAKKGDIYWLEVIAHRFALDSDPFLFVQRVAKNDKGEEQVSTVAQIDDPDSRNNSIQSAFDSSTDDPTWKLVADQDATYRVMVYDQFNSSRDDPRYAYRLIVRKEDGDFQLIARPAADLSSTNANQVSVSSPAVRRGGTTVIDLDINRFDGFAGEIEISVEGLPSGVTSQGALAGGEVNSVPLVISAADNAASWAGPIRVVGKAKIGDKEVTREARTAVYIWGTSNVQQELPQARLSQDIMLSVIEKESDPLATSTEEKVWETALGGEIEIPLKVSKRGEIKGDVKLVCVGLPNELKINDVSVKGGEGDATAKLTINNNNAKPGTYTFFFNAQGKYAYERNPDAVTKAEEYQKMAEEMVKSLDEEVKKAAETAKQADEALKKAQEELKSAAEDQKQAKQEAVTAAEEAKKQADEASKQVQDRKKRADDLKKKADSDLDNLKKANAKKDINFGIASVPFKLRLAREPFVIKEIAPITVKQDAKAEITVKVERLFGYNDPIEVHFEAPGGVNGLTVPKVDIGKDQSEVKVEVSANASANPGQHEATIRFRHKLGNQTLDTRQTFPLTIEEVKKDS